MTKNLHLRELRSVPFAENEERIPISFRQWVAKHLIPLLGLRGYPKTLRRKHEIAIQVLHHLVRTGETDRCVADSRDCRISGVRIRTGVWDAVVSAGFCNRCLGSERSGKQTRYRASRKLLHDFCGWRIADKIDLNLVRNSVLEKPTKHALAYAHTGKRDPLTGKLRPKGQREKLLPMPKDDAEFLRYYREVEDSIEAINDVNNRFVWTACKFDNQTGEWSSLIPVNVSVRQVNTPTWGHHTRLYSFSEYGYQNLSAEERLAMTCDGESLAALDMAAFATRYLYHLEGIDPDRKKDLYQPERIFRRYYASPSATTSDKALARRFVKLATNTCWNAISRIEAYRTARVFVFADNKYFTRDERARLRRIVRFERKPVEVLINRIRNLHDTLARRFPDRDGIRLHPIGSRVMTTDGGIMLRILTRITSRGRPALGLHDGVICRSRDVALVRAVMETVYAQHNPSGFKPVIRVEDGCA